ncbi:MAG: primosomal protein N', partial [Myxococcota bacterium]
MATETFADVAIPVPLRRTFTYRVPEKLLGKVQRGSRVAVAFQRRKVPAIVTALHHTPPDVARIVTIAGLIEPEPLYDEELLGFLEEAAKYYFHPLGEVLRAAAPAVPTGAMSRLRAGGFLAADETLPGAKIAERTELYYSRVGSREGVRLGAAQARFFEAIEEGVEVPLSHLRKAFPRARSLGRALTEKGLIHVDERLMRGTLFQAPVRRDAPPALTPAQQIAAKAIREGLHTSGQFLLHGVTGSGKTEVYLDAIAKCLQGGRGALVLVPEIALTPQLVGRFRARLGDDFAVLHSALTPRERDDAWRQLRSGELRLVVGARSALLAPVPNLGLIVVDEEHDGSYKQEDGFRYNARDMALLRAHRAGAVALLGSATPSIESKHRTERRSTLLTLPARAGGQPMPTVEVLDMRRHGSRPGRHHLLSGPLEAALEQCLERKEQAILFLNRRGFSPSVRCTACGELRECPSCSVALTLHQREGRLRCHYCDYRAPIPERCPACGADALEHMGLGTEQLESMLTENFPGARVGRLDRDVASGRSIEAILKRFRARELDVLVGTQMVTKGHDVPGVTLVGVLAADQSLVHRGAAQLANAGIGHTVAINVD